MNAFCQRGLVRLLAGRAILCYTVRRMLRPELSRLAVGLLTAAFILTLAPWLDSNQLACAQGERLVLAFYYPWFDANTWDSGKVSDLPLSNYNSDDPAVMARQIDDAKGAGIDAFVLNWWGTQNRTNKNLKALLDVAAQKGFRVAVDFDTNSPVMGGRAAYAENLQHLLSVHAAHPAYLRFEGRPVIFFYNVSRLSATAWREIRARVDPNRQSIWIAEGTSLKFLPVFDGHHLYSITWPNRIPPADTLSKFARQVRKHNSDNGAAKLWVATVMPGYDDTRARKSGFARARDGGDYYRQCWEAAIASKPHWVVINSYNEWVEGSQIEPGRSYGSLYLDLTREMAARFRAADHAAIAQAPAEAQPVPVPSPSPPKPRPPKPTPPPSPASPPAPVPPPPRSGKLPLPLPL